MSLHLDFEPHSWYMGFAIRQIRKPAGELVGERGHSLAGTRRVGITWEAYTADGMSGFVATVEADTFADLKERIRQWHLDRHTGYGERIAARRLAYLRGEIEAERISYGEQVELQGLADYIPAGDVLLSEWAGVPERRES